MRFMSETAQIFDRTDFRDAPVDGLQPLQQPRINVVNRYIRHALWYLAPPGAVFSDS